MHQFRKHCRDLYKPWRMPVITDHAVPLSYTTLLRKKSGEKHGGFAFADAIIADSIIADAIIRP